MKCVLFLDLKIIPRDDAAVGYFEGSFQVVHLGVVPAQFVADLFYQLGGGAAVVPVVVVVHGDWLIRLSELLWCGFLYVIRY